MSLLILFPASQGESPTTGTATFAQTGSWAAVQTERIPATATFAQSATWAASASERITTTASFGTVAVWDAVGASIQPVTGTGDFAQTGSWAGLVAHADSAISGTASFEQGIPVFSGTTVLRIVGYASPLPPTEFLNVTGSILEDWLP